MTAPQQQPPARRNQTLVIVLSAVVAVAAVVVALVVVANTSGGSSKPEARVVQSEPTPSDLPSDNAPATTAPPAPGTCQYDVSGVAAKPAKVPPARPRSTGTQTATLSTSQGTITIQLLDSKAPCTVGSFTSLAEQQYFDGTKCHRLTTANIYVLQCGDPTGTGGGGPGYEFADENLEGATYPAGTVAMANAGPGTNGSQFFLVYEDTELPPSYTPFGRITGGLDVVKKVAAAGVADGSGDGAPKLPTTLTKVAISD